MNISTLSAVVSMVTCKTKHWLTYKMTSNISFQHVHLFLCYIFLEFWLSSASTANCDVRLICVTNKTAANASRFVHPDTCKQTICGVSICIYDQDMGFGVIISHRARQLQRPIGRQAQAHNTDCERALHTPGHWTLWNNGHVEGTMPFNRPRVSLF